MWLMTTRAIGRPTGHTNELLTLSSTVSQAMHYALLPAIFLQMLLQRDAAALGERPKRGGFDVISGDTPGDR
jgi:hypothetical protein